MPLLCVKKQKVFSPLAQKALILVSRIKKNITTNIQNSLYYTNGFTKFFAKVLISSPLKLHQQRHYNFLVQLRLLSCS